MSKAAVSISVWAVYALVVGTLFAVIPDTVLDLLGLPETKDVWIRVVGLVVLVLALYYWDAARNEARHLFVASVLGRGFLVLALVALWLAGQPWQLLFIAAVELVGATWTVTSLRAETAGS